MNSFINLPCIICLNFIQSCDNIKQGEIDSIGNVRAGKGISPFLVARLQLFSSWRYKYFELDAVMLMVSNESLTLAFPGIIKWLSETETKYA